MKSMKESIASKRLTGIEAQIKKKMQEWSVPGAAVAVIHKEEVLYCSGFGYRDVNKQLPVDAETLFGIGSSTKPFTTMILAMLVQEGKIEWDTPIKEYLPNFRMYDAVATEMLTFRDIACHRSGMPDHNFMCHKPMLTAQQWVDALPYLEPNLSFRHAFQYSSLMYAEAGYLIECLTGITYEEWVRKRIFTPLNMMNSNFSVEQTTAGSNFSMPYVMTENGIVELPFTSDQPGAAGAINSSVAELSAWVSFQLNRGVVKGQRQIQEDIIQELYIPQIIVRQGGALPEFPEMPHTTYGLGWFIDCYRGHHLVHHAGRIDGFTAHVSFIPEKDVGIVVLANQNISFLPDSLAYTLYDQLLGMETIDWTSKFQQHEKKLYEMIAAMNPAADPVDVPNAQKDLLPLDSYTGLYNHPAYGDITIKQVDGKLVFDYRTLISDLTGLNSLQFLAEDVGLPFIFTVDEHEKVVGVQLPLEPSVQPIAFSKQS